MGLEGAEKALRETAQWRFAGCSSAPAPAPAPIAAPVPQPGGPTDRNYGTFREAYDFFNEALFEGRLPPCLITLQRKAKTGGYFAQERFGSRTRDEVTDEIALNPSQFEAHTDAETLSLLVSRMVHLQQFRCHPDTVSRPGYCNKTWARLMHRVGLVPPTLGSPADAKPAST